MKRDLCAFIMTIAAMGCVLFLAMIYEPRAPQKANAMELYCQNTGKFTKAERVCP